MKKFALSTFWVVTVAVNSGTTAVNVNMPENSFSVLMNTIQALTGNAGTLTTDLAANPNIWGSTFLAQLFSLF